MINEFEVGKQYKGWSSERYEPAHPLVVTEIADDRSYLMGYNPNKTPHLVEKYQIKRSEWNEKVSSHPMRGVWFAWRADKVEKDVDLSDEDFIDGQKARRKAGAEKASKTKSERLCSVLFLNSSLLNSSVKPMLKLKRNVGLVGDLMNTLAIGWTGSGS